MKQTSLSILELRVHGQRQVHAPVVEASWLREQHASVQAYLSSERAAHGGVSDAPAWFVAPYLAIWRSRASRTASIGWWVASGDVPTDYLSSAGVRDAGRRCGVSVRWDHLAARMNRETHPACR